MAASRIGDSIDTDAPSLPHSLKALWGRHCPAASWTAAPIWESKLASDEEKLTPLLCAPDSPPALRPRNGRLFCGGGESPAGRPAGSAVSLSSQHFSNAELRRISAVEPQTKKSKGCLQECIAGAARHAAACPGLAARRSARTSH